MIKILPGQIEALKYIAIILMFFDHLDTIFFDYVSFFKLIGRVVYPLFVFIMVYNFIHNTKDKKQYILRLLIFAIISEPIHYFAFNDYYTQATLNIMFTLCIGMIGLSIFSISSFKIKTLVFLIYAIFIYLSYKILCYSFFGVLVIFTTYFYLNKSTYLNLFFLSLSIWTLNILWDVKLSLFALLSLVIIYLISKIDINIPRVNKYVFYIFYPFHMLILKLFKILM